MLSIYYRNTEGSYVEVSKDDDLTTPISTTHNGQNSDTIILPLYLRNDESTRWYSNIRILPLDLEDANPYGDVAFDETGWGVKLSVGGTEPTNAEWDDINWGEEIEMSDVGSDSLADTTTYFPFYYLITSPPNTDAQTKTDIVLQTSYTENAVA